MPLQSQPTVHTLRQACARPVVHVQQPSENRGVLVSRAWRQAGLACYITAAIGAVACEVDEHHTTWVHETSTVPAPVHIGINTLDGSLAAGPHTPTTPAPGVNCLVADTPGRWYACQSHPS
eukprot:m.1497293 g.1497293  ORF g.1497293 m.1497293 type:complete len:121 (-) comp25198_c0_seq13:5-367(-)